MTVIPAHGLVASRAALGPRRPCAGRLARGEDAPHFGLRPHYAALELLLLNPCGIARYSVALTDLVGDSLETGTLSVVLGDYCSIVPGCLLAVKRRGRFVLLSLDDRADSNQPEADPCGEATSMGPALVTGRGPVGKTDIEGSWTPVLLEEVVVLGRRDVTEAAGGIEHGSRHIDHWTIALVDPAAASVGHLAGLTHGPAVPASFRGGLFFDATTVRAIVLLQRGRSPLSRSPYVRSPRGSARPARWRCSFRRPS